MLVENNYPLHSELLFGYQTVILSSRDKNILNVLVRSEYASIFFSIKQSHADEPECGTEAVNGNLTKVTICGVKTSFVVILFSKLHLKWYSTN